MEEPVKPEYPINLYYINDDYFYKASDVAQLLQTMARDMKNDLDQTLTSTQEKMMEDAVLVQKRLKDVFGINDEQINKRLSKYSPKEKGETN